MAKSFFDLKNDIFETLTEASALERRAAREQKQADMAKVAAEQDRKRRRAREARQDYRRDRKRALELESFKVGDSVHLGHATKGGTGVKGKVHKIDGNTVHIKNDKGDIFKGPRDRVSTAESFDKLTPKQERDAERRLKPTRATVGKVRLRASDAEVADKVKQHQSEKGGNPGNTKKRRIRDLRLRDHVELEESNKAKFREILNKGKKLGDWNMMSYFLYDGNVWMLQSGRAVNQGKLEVFMKKAQSGLINSLKFESVQEELGLPNHHPDHHVYKSTEHNLRNGGNPTTRKRVQQYATRNRIRMSPDEAKAINAKGKHGDAFREQQRRVQQHLKDRHTTKKESFGLEEAHAKDIVKGLTDMDGPFTVVAIKNNKVISQEGTKMRNMLPAIVKVMRKKLGSGVTISIEDRKGTIRNTFKEGAELGEGIRRVERQLKSKAVRTNINKADQATVRKRAHRGEYLRVADPHNPRTSDDPKQQSPRNPEKRESGRRTAPALDAQRREREARKRKKKLEKIRAARAESGATRVESVEHLDELSPVKLKKYSQRATRDREDTVRRGYDPMAGRLDPKSEKRRKKRVAGIAKAQRKMATAAEEVEQVDELKSSTLRSYHQKAQQDMSNIARDSQSTGPLTGKTLKKFVKRQKGRNAALSRLDARKNNLEPELKREEIEQVDELKKSTLQSYVRKRSGQVRSDLSTGQHSPATNKKAKGVSKANRRLTAYNANRIGAMPDRPEVKKIASKVQDSYEPEGESIDELKSSTLRSYLDKSRKQNQKRVTRMADQPDHMPADKGEMHKLRKRRKGSEQAASRLDARKHNLEPRLKRDGSEG